jgi:hypothetical protein
MRGQRSRECLDLIPRKWVDHHRNDPLHISFLTPTVAIIGPHGDSADFT